VSYIKGHHIKEKEREKGKGRRGRNREEKEEEQHVLMLTAKRDLSKDAGCVCVFMPKR
jgi:hypothetical protein